MWVSGYKVRKGERKPELNGPCGAREAACGADIQLHWYQMRGSGLLWETEI